MSKKIVTVIDVTIIVTREAKEATVIMTGKEEIVIVLTVKPSHIMWMKSIVALTSSPRATVAVALQAAAALVFTLTQMKSSKVTIIIVWTNPTWITRCMLARI
eukprot:1798299-Ditylum_brightwellii.AAC.1